VQGASPLRLVVLLYEQAIEDLRRALAAQRRGEVEVRTRDINHAILVIGHLQTSLDQTQGGEVATNLRNFYAMVRAGLVEAQCRQSESLLDHQISHLLTVHDAWCRAEREVAEQEAGPGARANSGMEWRA